MFYKTNIACLTLIIAKCASVLFSIATQPFYPDGPVVSDDFAMLRAFNIVNGVFSIVCFAAIVWLCVLLMLRFRGRVRTLGIVWLITVCLPTVMEVLMNVVFAYTGQLPKVLYDIDNLIILVCALIPLLLIIRCFRFPNTTDITQ